MSTMIAVYNSSGCVGRCDAKCYEATQPGCVCVCGGKNHGVGQKQAVENTRELAEAWLKEYTHQHGLENWTAEIPARQPVQLALF